jgi:ABC-type polysaccharide/polyol phosphate export permease
MPSWAFWIYEHVPMAVAVRLFRTLLYDARYPTPQQFGYLAVWGAFMLWLGWTVFKRLAPRFPEEL